MNKSFIKFITDFGPLVVFFSFYYKSEKNLQVAIPPLIIATIISVIIVWILEKKIPFVPLLGGVLITFFGGLTIYFEDPIFIYMKPTIINTIFAFALYFGKYFTREPILKKILGKTMLLNNEGWGKLNTRWMFFFIFLAILNEIVWRSYAPEKEYIWVNFKVWGILPLTFVFTALQLPLINKYKKNEEY